MCLVLFLYATCFDIIFRVMMVQRVGLSLLPTILRPWRHNMHILLIHCRVQLIATAMPGEQLHILHAASQVL